MSTARVGEVAAPLAGKVLGRYRLERLLGEGGMGVVYAARHEDLGRLVAVKILNERYDASEQTRARFLREGQTASRIGHPNIVDVYDAGTEGDRAFLVMELLHGEDLRVLLRREGPLSVERTADLLVPVISALSAAHDAGVVHRDLKPDNIFLSIVRNRLAPKVLDFGISKLIDESREASLTSTGALLGTPFYMSPEQARAIDKIDARSDQYSIGVILYECVTGRRPIEEASIYSLIQRIVNSDFAPPRQLSPSLPCAFEQLILRAMAGDPSQRFANLRPLGRALLEFTSEQVRANYADDFAGDEPPPSAAIEPSAPAPELATTLDESSVRERRPWSQRRPRWARTTAFGAGLLALATLIVIEMGSRTPPSPAPARATARVSPAPARETSEVSPAPPSVPASAAASASRSKVLRSQPPGANVWIAGKLIGQTPLPVSVQGDSPVAVELQLSGFETQQRALTPSDPDEIVIELAATPLGPKRARPRPVSRPELAPR